MNTLVTGIIICVAAVFFVNVLLFGALRISLSSVPLGTLLGVEAVFALFFVFLYLVAMRKH